MPKPPFIMVISQCKGATKLEYRRLNALTLSEQAKREILTYIRNMDFEKNNKLPREESLAEIIGVSRITIRQALNDLAAEGIVFRRQGKGTFVNVDSLNVKVTFNPCMDFTQMIQNSGYQPSVKLLSIARVPREEAVCQALHMSPEEQLILAEKFFFADNTLCAFCRDYFSLSLIGGEDSFAEFSSYENSIYEYIYSLSGQRIQWDKVEIDTILTTEVPGLSQYTDLEKLGTRPFLYLRSVNYSSNDAPLILANEYINTAIVKFNMIRQKNIRY